MSDKGNVELGGTDPQKMSRWERRDRKRYFKKELEKHKQNKPNVETSITATKEQLDKQQAEIRSWAVRKMILEKKIKEFSYGSRKYKRGVQKRKKS